jgi:Ni,Fe-hydrogenase I small subunit
VPGCRISGWTTAQGFTSNPLLFLRDHGHGCSGCFLTAWWDARTFAFANHAKALTGWKNGANLAEPVSVLESGFDYYSASDITPDHS